jgi:hypothetical protein
MDRLFIGIFPAGISYADRTREEHGDYKQVAFLSYATLKIEWRGRPDAAIRAEVEAHAATMRARAGGTFTVSACGQTVRLGSAL